MPSLLHGCAQSLLSPPLQLLLRSDHSSALLPPLCSCGPGWSQTGSRWSAAHGANTRISTVCQDSVRHGDALIDPDVRVFGVQGRSAKLLQLGVLLSLQIFSPLCSRSSPFLSCLSGKGWTCLCSVTRRFFSPARTGCKEQWVGTWRIQPRFSLPSRPESTSVINVAADMSFGNRFFLVSLFLGIVLTRFGRCNQGEFNRSNPGILNLFNRHAVDLFIGATFLRCFLILNI